jgi:hypothetical protein
VVPELVVEEDVVLDELDEAEVELLEEEEEVVAPLDEEDEDVAAPLEDEVLVLVDDELVPAPPAPPAPPVPCWPTVRPSTPVTRLQPVAAKSTPRRRPLFPDMAPCYAVSRGGQSGERAI